MEQDSIQSTPLGRMAVLASSGTRVGINYLKHYGKASLAGTSGADTRDALDAINASEIYTTFSQLKGGPLKLAQMLSIDKSLLPPAYANQFAKAQYSAPPLSYPLVARTFRREFGKEPGEMFDSFEQKAAHGASIGQVHKARRGDKVYAVKVQYPGVAESLQTDLRVIKPIALRIINLREADVVDYLKEVEIRLLEETNYTLELERSIALSAASAHLPNLGFPKYYPEMSSSRILTMDWVNGITFDRFADGDASQEERDLIGQTLWDFYAFQVHEMRLFHADPHPGNFLVSEGKLWVLDFGCTKALEEEFYRKQFRFLDPELLGNRERLIQVMVDLDIVLPTDTPAQKELIIALCEKSLELLARPFRNGSFDFGNVEFMRAIYDMGEQNRTNPDLRRMRGRRGSAESIYVNRTFFGLYSLLSRLRARVKTELPEWLRQPVQTA